MKKLTVGKKVYMISSFNNSVEESHISDVLTNIAGHQFIQLDNYIGANFSLEYLPNAVDEYKVFLTKDEAVEVSRRLQRKALEREIKNHKVWIRTHTREQADAERKLKNLT